LSKALNFSDEKIQNQWQWQDVKLEIKSMLNKLRKRKRVEKDTQEERLRKKRKLRHVPNSMSK
jgi:hypothetical protein